MSDLKFKAQTRKDLGKAHASSLRRQGKVPAVLYGQGGEPQSLEVVENEIEILIAKTWGRNALLKMEVENNGAGADEKVVMFKELQREPVKNKLLHVDFYQVDMQRKLKLKIPVVLEGVAAGVKEGGILQHSTRSLNVRCLPSAIPTSIKVNVSELKLDQSILLEDLPKQEGIEFLDGRHTVLAHVAAVEEEAAAPAPGAAAEGAAPAQPEVIGEKEREAKRAEKEGAKPGAAPATEAGKVPAGKAAAPAAAAKPAAKK